MNNTFRNLSVFATLLLSSVMAYGQATMTQTTLSQALSNPAASGGGNSYNTVFVASATNITGAGTLGQPQTIMVIDQEAMDVIAVSGTTVTVTRGTRATKTQAHNSGAVVWIGIPSYFGDSSTEQYLSGTCSRSGTPALPHIRIPSGQVYDCPSSGTNASQWVLLNGVDSTPNSVEDALIWEPFTSCVQSPSGNSTGTNGFTTAGTSLTPVVQNQTSGSGTNTHNYVCVLHPPSSLSTYGIGRGAQVKDVQFYYGVQTTALGTQAATLASGTLNSVIVFSYINMPAPGASETASTVAPVRADSGNLLLTPAVASFNTGTTTAGAFYSELFTPATPIPVNTDRQELLFSVALLNTATSATITNSPGLLVHWIYTPF